MSDGSRSVRSEPVEPTEKCNSDAGSDKASAAPQSAVATSPSTAAAVAMIDPASPVVSLQQRRLTSDRSSVVIVASLRNDYNNNNNSSAMNDSDTKPVVVVATDDSTPAAAAMSAPLAPSPPRHARRSSTTTLQSLLKIGSDTDSLQSLVETRESLRARIALVKKALEAHAAAKARENGVACPMLVSDVTSENDKLESEIQELRGRITVEVGADKLHSMSEQLALRQVEVKALQLQRRGLCQENAASLKLIEELDVAPSREKIFLEAQEEKRHHEQQEIAIRAKIEKVNAQIETTSAKLAVVKKKAESAQLASCTPSDLDALRRQDAEQQKRLARLNAIIKAFEQKSTTVPGSGRHSNNGESATVPGENQSSNTPRPAGGASAAVAHAGDAEAEWEALRERLKHIHSQIAQRDEVITNNRTAAAAAASSAVAQHKKAKKAPEQQQQQREAQCPSPPKTKKDVARRPAPAVKPVPKKVTASKVRTVEQNPKQTDIDAQNPKTERTTPIRSGTLRLSSSSSRASLPSTPSSSSRSSPSRGGVVSANNGRQQEQQQQQDDEGIKTRKDSVGGKMDAKASAAAQEHAVLHDDTASFVGSVAPALPKAVEHDHL